MHFYSQYNISSNYNWDKSDLQSEGPFKIMIPSYQYRDSHYKDKTVW